jgi:hypothetical protein
MTEPRQAVPEEAADALLWRRWRRGERVDVADFLAGFTELEAVEVVAVLLVDQRERWQLVHDGRKRVSMSGKNSPASQSRGILTHVTP